MQTIEQIQDEISQYQFWSDGNPDYFVKMVHLVPEAKTVVRVPFVQACCNGKVVLNIGCASGTFHDELKGVAKQIYGVDIEQCEFEGFYQCDVEEDPLPELNDIEVVVCGEIIEHLANPGIFLKKLKRYAGAEFVITVPNCLYGAVRIKNGRVYENVNYSHTCWYSPKTIRTLLERYGFAINEFYWYGGVKGPNSEGMILVCSQPT